MAAREIPGLATVLDRIDGAMMAPAAAWCEHRGVQYIFDLKELGDDDEIEDFMEAAGLTDFERKLVKKRIMELTRPPPSMSPEITGLREVLADEDPDLDLSDHIPLAALWCARNGVRGMATLLAFDDVAVVKAFLDGAGLEGSRREQVWYALLGYAPSAPDPSWDDACGETLAEHVLRTVPRVFEGLDDMLPAGSFSAKNRARAVGWCERRAIYDVEDLRRYFSAAATTHMNTPPEMLGP